MKCFSSSPFAFVGGDRTKLNLTVEGFIFVIYFDIFNGVFFWWLVLRSSCFDGLEEQWENRAALFVLAQDCHFPNFFMYVMEFCRKYSASLMYVVGTQKNST